MGNSEASQRRDGFGITALVFGILGVLLSLTWAFLRWPWCEISLPMLDTVEG